MMQRDTLAMYYSADPDMTIKDIKEMRVNTSICMKSTEKEMKTWGIHSYVVGSKNYHYKFHYIPRKPSIMYAYGDISCLDAGLLGVVGPRKTSRYAELVLGDMFQDISGYDLCTISGGASGIDMLAHTHSLSYGLPTVVVLGGGLLHYLKGYKRKFLESVVQAGGLILSEFKLYQEPTPRSFPQRNRIIAGLCDMLFLPAAGKKSGSLITVDFARGVGKPVYSVPGSIYNATSAGSNAYIQEGKIIPMVNYIEILDMYFQKKVGHIKSHDVSLSKIQQTIIDYLQGGNSPDTSSVAAHIGYTYVDTLAELSMLEVIGSIFFVSDESAWQLRM